MSEIARTSASSSSLLRRSSRCSSSKLTSKWSSMAVLPRPVTITIWFSPDWLASSMPYWISGLSTSGSISLGMALVAGRKRVPRPAAGKTALRTFGIIPTIVAILSNGISIYDGVGNVETQPLFRDAASVGEADAVMSVDVGLILQMERLLAVPVGHRRQPVIATQRARLQ